VADVPDFGDVLRQAMELQQQLVAAREEADRQVVTGSAGGGVVRVELTGGGEVTAVHINPEVVQPDDVELLEDLVLAALRDAQQQVNTLQAATMGGLPGLADLGGIGGVPGTGPPGVPGGASLDTNAVEPPAEGD
jgi:DNA-binding YbaB/EbfC family protein